MGGFARAAGLVLASVLLVGLRPSAQAAGAVQEYTVVMTDYKFTPDRFTWRVGDVVRITFKDESQGKKDHEFLMGREVVMGGDFGDKPEGLKTPLLDDRSQFVVLQGEKIEELQTDQPGMIALEFGGTATVQFVVPNKPGVWEMACFEESGDHYLEGMKGTITIVR